MENISIEALFFKGIPADIRGTMLGLFWFCASLGLLSFTIIGGYLFDEIGPASPFAFLLILDCTFLILVVLLGLCGKIKD